MKTTTLLRASMLLLVTSGGLAQAQQYDRAGHVVPGTEPTKGRPPLELPNERLPEQQPQPPRGPLSNELVSIEWPHVEGGSAVVDRASVSVDPDDVVRYVLITITPDGKRQTTFEGIRCAPNEWRVYSFGRSDGGWAPNYTSQWQPAYEAGPGGPRFVLARDYLCTRGRRPAQDARNALDARGGSSVMRRND